MSGDLYISAAEPLFLSPLQEKGTCYPDSPADAPPSLFCELFFLPNVNKGFLGIFVCSERGDTSPRGFLCLVEQLT